MVEGSSFGEIGLIHRGPRTADVIAKNYITLARIKLEQFQILIDQVDHLKKLLTRQICSYEYSRKTFAKKILKRIDFFNEITNT